MTSRGHMIFVHVNQSVTLECQFRAVRFSLFDNPVVWKKIQRDERTQINILSNIVEPFFNTSRLSVSFVPGDSSVYRMSLRLRGTKLVRSVAVIVPLLLARLHTVQGQTSKGRWRLSSSVV